MKKSFVKIINKLINLYSSIQIDSTNKYDSTNYFLSGTELYHTKWGKYSICNKKCIISKAIIGNYCQISHHVTIAPRDHIYSNFSIHDRIYKKTKEHLFNRKIWDNKYLVKIGDDVWIGCYVVIMHGVEIGNGAIIGAGSIITKSVPAYSMVAGNPAKIIRYRFSAEQINNLERTEWYGWDINKVIKNKDKLEQIVNFNLDDFKVNQMSKKPYMSY